MISVKSILALGSFARLYGVLKTLIGSDPNPFSGRNIRAPKARVFVEIDATNSACVVPRSLLISGICYLIYLAQIANAIVAGLAINVVDLINRRAPIVKRPYNSVHLITFSKDANRKVPFLITASVAGPLVSIPGIPAPRLSLVGKHIFQPRPPIQKAGFWIVIQKLAKNFNIRQLFSSHFGPPLKVLWLEHRETAPTVPMLDNSPKTFGFQRERADHGIPE